MDRIMPRTAWQAALLSLAITRQKLLAAHQVEVHLLLGKAGALLEEQRPFTASVVLRQILHDRAIPVEMKNELLILAESLSHYAGVAPQAPDPSGDKNLSVPP